MIQGTIFDIKRYALHDGPGIRVTVFFKGCPLSCWWCHNPESRSPIPEVLPARCAPETAGTTRPCETVGRAVTVEEVLDEIDKETLFLEESGGGVTFSGGEPLFQPEFLRACLEGCRERGLHTLLDTTGYAPWPDVDKVRRLVDLFYYDLKLLDNEEHREHTGVGNTEILDNLEALRRAGSDIVVRFPVVPGVTDTPRNVEELSRVMRRLGLDQLDLLPYHRLGSDKYRWLGMEDRGRAIKPPLAGEVEALRNRFRKDGVKVRIGG